MNVIARLEFELAKYDSTVLRFNHYIPRTLPNRMFSSSSSSCRAARPDIPDPLSPIFPIVHRLWQGSLWLHPVSSHSCCTYVLAGRPAFARPYSGVHRRYITYEAGLCFSSSVLRVWFSLSLDSFSWWGGRWPYRGCFCGVVLPPGLIQYLLVNILV